MKDRSRKRRVVSIRSRFFWCTLVAVFFCVLFTSSSFCTVGLFFGEKFHPEILSWRPPVMQAMLSDSQPNLPVLIRDAVILPDHVLLFLEYPHSARLFTKEDFDCVYLLDNLSSFKPQLRQPPISIDGGDANDQIVRCPLSPPGSDVVSLALKSGQFFSPGTTCRWDSLAYEALIDYDNTTVVFVKGLNLRPEKIYNTTRFECLYGWDFNKPKFLLRSNVVSVAQEIIRCQTPLSILSNKAKVHSSSIKVSIRVKGGGTFDSIARPANHITAQHEDPSSKKTNEMCICTMLRNQAGFLKEWVMYHAHIGVERWFIYDNNSDDEIISVIESLVKSNYNISRHLWPWVKTQEAGFAHCALRARAWCEWVGFIDVDEFLHFPTGLNLPELIKNQSEMFPDVAELRTTCHSFGPSGLKELPRQGVAVGYTCRLVLPERHKSIVKPGALNSSLINVVHHFHLKDEFRHVNVDRGLMVINHYKYQVWEAFKQKFYRRVATYVADWQNEQNVGSKDRTPGLGTRPVEPTDWASRFCEVNDTGLRDRVVENFLDPLTNLLPWQEVEGTKN